MGNWDDIAPLLPQTIKIGTRGSKLALAQAEEVKAKLLVAYPALTPERLELVIITTSGDQILDLNLSEIGGKGLFTKEIEEALIDGSIDIAVHSMKDLPAFEPPLLVTECTLSREDPRDAFISPKYHSIQELPKGAVVGTSSTRRQAQLLRIRPDVKVVPFRGNVQTRLQKLKDGVADATFLAVAGLNRINASDHITTIMEPSDMLPAVAQGAIGVQHRKDHPTMRAFVRPLNHEATAYCVRAERAFMKVLDGSCRTPMAAHAELDGDILELKALIAKPDGTLVYKTSRKGTKDQAEQMGRDAGLELKTKDNGVILCA
ncbi:MAG: hemC [Rickettsiales bacterium]|jgi:hydroxymethylbilane synthase|nr:hemC [Rickettsiales bacterium]